jgi:hypothetical protein
MSIVDTVKRLGRPPIPRGDATTAARVQEKLDAAIARLTELHRQQPDIALAATLEEPGADEELGTLQGRMAEQEKLIATLQSALAAAERADARLIAAQRAHLHRSAVLTLKRHLEKRDAAAQSFSVAMENAVNSYRQMVAAADAAMRSAQPLMQQSSPYITGSRLIPRELYAAAAQEMRRLSSPFPITPENSLLPKFPYDPSAAGSSMENVGSFQPLADDLKRRTEGLIDQLTGKEPN